MQTDIGPISAGQVVLAAGAWSPRSRRQLGLDLPIHPMRLQVVQTEPMAPRLEHLLYGPAAVKQYAIFQELDSFTRETFSTDLERAARPGAPRIGLPDRRRFVPPGHRDGLHRSRLEAGSSPASPWWPKACSARSRACAPPASRRHGPGSCRSRRQPAADRPRTGSRRPDHRGGPCVREWRGPDYRSTRGRPHLRRRARRSTQPRSAPTDRVSRPPRGEHLVMSDARGAPDRVHQPVRYGGLRRDHPRDPRPLRHARDARRRHPPRGRAREHRLLLPQAPHGAGHLREGPPARGGGLRRGRRRVLLRPGRARRARTRRYPGHRARSRRP